MVDGETEREFTDFVTQRTHAPPAGHDALTGDQHAAEDLLQASAFARWSRIRFPRNRT